MGNDEKKLEHLKLIEGVIERMASNSLRLKEWFITVASAIVGLCFTMSEPKLLFVAGGVLLAFWFLDANYLQQERNFRDLYKAVVESDDSAITDFSLDVSAVRSKQSYFWALLGSWATSGFYGLILVLLIVLWCNGDLISQRSGVDSLPNVKTNNVVEAIESHNVIECIVQ